MRSLVVLVLLGGRALAEPPVHALASTNGEWRVSPQELAKDLNARLAADKGTPRLANPKDSKNYRALLVRGPE